MSARSVLTDTLNHTYNRTMKVSRRKIVTALGTCCWFLVYLFRRKEGKVSISADQKSQSTGDFAAEGNDRPYSRTHQERIDHMQEICKNTSLWRNTIYKGNYSTKFYYSRDYNFSYCKVPKCGSTFWTQTFSILKHGQSYYDQAFGVKRIDVHLHSGVFLAPFPQVKKRRVVLVSRDPYSRLFSAYVDKCFLPLMYPLNQNIVQYLSLDEDVTFCQNNVTFQEFLNYVTGTAFDGMSLNSHWAPIASLCRPCDVNRFALVKQESFSKDVEDVLEVLGVEQDKLDSIKKALYDHRVDATIPGVVETIMDSVREEPNVTACIGWKEVAQRIWTSCQIQGYIKENISFPFERIDTAAQYDNTTLLVNVILDTIAANPMTPADSKDQRRKALVSAYKTIRSETIQAIQEVYREDFEIYGYAITPPK